MWLTVESCKLKWSTRLNFLPMALANLPDMFDFKKLRNVYFTHFLNTRENQNIVLEKLSDIHFYNPDGMKPEDRKNFLSWYQKHKDERFDLQENFLVYCKSDFDILKRCCMKFRDDFMDITVINQLDKYITIISVCNFVFRTWHNRSYPFIWLHPRKEAIGEGYAMFELFIL